MALREELRGHWPTLDEERLNALFHFLSHHEFETLEDLIGASAHPVLWCLAH